MINNWLEGVIRSGWDNFIGMWVKVSELICGLSVEVSSLSLLYSSDFIVNINDGFKGNRFMDGITLSVAFGTVIEEF